MLPDELDTRLRHEARRKGVSIADVARRAIERQLSSPVESRLSFFAIGAGGPVDASERVDDFVGDAIDRQHPA